METSCFRTTNLEQAAAILATGTSKFVGLERRSHRTFAFVFDSDQICRRHAEEFRCGLLIVNAKAMADALQVLKDSIFSTLRDRDGGIKWETPTRPPSSP